MNALWLNVWLKNSEFLLVFHVEISKKKNTRDRRERERVDFTLSQGGAWSLSSFPSSSHFFFFFFFFFFCCCVERMTFPVFFSERSVGWRGNSRLAWVFLLRANLKTPREISKTREHWGIWGVFLSLSRWSHVFHTPQNTKSTLHLHRPLHEKKREVSKKKKKERREEEEERESNAL